MKEAEVWQQFKLAWPHLAIRQEPGLGAGQPDVLLQDRLGRPGFVELKASDRIELNPEQWIWHEIWWKKDGRTVVVSCERYHRYDIRWRVFLPEFKPRALQELYVHPVPRIKMLRLVSSYLGLKL